MSVDGHNFGFSPNKFLEIFEIADDDFLFRVISEEQGLNHSQSIWHILGPSIRPRLINQRVGIHPFVAVFRGNSRR